MKSAFLFAVLPALLGLTACGSGKQKPTSASGTITATAAQEFVTKYSTDIQKSANGFDADAVKKTFVSTSTTRSRLGAFLNQDTKASARADCDPTVGGTTTDADGDTIPVNATYSFASCPAGAGTYSGGFSLVDEDDTKALPLKGFRLGIDNFTYSVSNSRETATIQTNGFYNVSIAAPTMTNSLELTYDLSTGSQSASAGFYFDTSATATDVAHPEAAGTIIFGGFFRLQGGDNNYTLQFTSSGLTYENPCGSFSDESHFLKAGTLTIKDGSNNTITGTFSNCAAVWKYNDTTLSGS